MNTYIYICRHNIKPTNKKNLGCPSYDCLCHPLGPGLLQILELDIAEAFGILRQATAWEARFLRF